MRKSILIAAAALACLPLPSSAQKQGDIFAYIGTYTRPNRSQGIYGYRFDTATGKFNPLGLAAQTTSPSFLAIHPNGRFLYAVNEIGTGTVSAFAIDTASGTLKALNSVSSKGSGPCHLMLDKTGKWLAVANYNNGSIAVYPVQADGSVGEASASVQHKGSSVDTRRQQGPHAHEVVFSPNNRFLLVPDLGMDQVLVYRFDAAKGTLEPNEPPAAKLAPGSGPRHLAFHPKGDVVYVLTEMGGTITAFHYDDRKGTFQEFQTIDTLPDNPTKPRSGAEIEVHPSGRFLYVSNRSNSSIGIFAIDPAKRTLTAAGTVALQGKNPRHFTIDPSGKYLVVANQDTNNAIVFRIDQKTGGLTPTGDVIESMSPVCVVFRRAK